MVIVSLAEETCTTKVTATECLIWCGPCALVVVLSTGA